MAKNFKFAKKLYQLEDEQKLIVEQPVSKILPGPGQYEIDIQQ